MRRCWVLVITKNTRVWMPPEVYLDRGMAFREAGRWTSVLSRRRTLPKLTSNSSVQLAANARLHLTEMEFLEPWRACPLWVGVRWSAKPGTKLRVELLAMDHDEAAAWVLTRSKVEFDPEPDPEVRFESTWDKGDVRHYVAVHRIKRFIGF